MSNLTTFSSTAFPNGLPRTLPVLREFSEVFQLVQVHAGHGAHVYVRYSLGPDADVFLPGSVDHRSSTPHDGLSAVDLTPPHGAAPSYGEVARRFRWFSYVLWQKPQTFPWLARGRECGRGAEGEPLLRDIEPIAYCDVRVAVEALWRADDEGVGKRIAREIIEAKLGPEPTPEQRVMECARWGIAA